MSLRITFPRLLPTTMVALAVLLTVKSADLVRAAMPARAEEPARAPSGSRPQPAPASVAGKAAAGPAGEPTAAPPAGSAARSTGLSSSPEAAPVSDGERAVLLELRQRRVELDARDAALSSREAVLAAAERKISARVDELQALQTRLEALEAARRARDDTNWRGMVKMYESMKPRDAAVIFNDLDMAVLLQVVDRMKEAKAAAVMAAMQPEKARQVTTELAQMRSRANADPAPAGG